MLLISQESFSTPKRAKCYGQEHESPHVSTSIESLRGSSLAVSTSENDIPSCSQTEQLTELLARKKDLIKLIQGKEESLRKLNLVKMYRNKVSNYYQLIVFCQMEFQPCSQGLSSSLGMRLMEFMPWLLIYAVFHGMCITLSI